jgi:dihydrofolate reductase
MLTLYNVISQDGFIARIDGSEDFIPDALWINFLNLCLEYGSLIMGRKTYDTIQAYDENLIKSFEKLPAQKIVVTDDRDFHPKDGYSVAHSPEEAVAMAPNSLVSSGPTLNNYLLEHRLVGKIILHEVPISIDEGIRPFKDMSSYLSKISPSQPLAGVNVREYLIS